MIIQASHRCFFGVSGRSVSGVSIGPIAWRHWLLARSWVVDSRFMVFLSGAMKGPIMMQRRQGVRPPCTCSNVNHNDNGDSNGKENSLWLYCLTGGCVTLEQKESNHCTLVNLPRTETANTIRVTVCHHWLSLSGMTTLAPKKVKAAKRVEQYKRYSSKNAKQIKS